MPVYTTQELKRLADSVANATPKTAVVVAVAANKGSTDYRRAQESVVNARRKAESHASLRRVR